MPWIAVERTSFNTGVVWPARHQWEERGLVLWATVAVRMTRRRMGVIVIMGDARATSSGL